MQTIQIALDEPLLKAADHAARQTKVDRSAFVREALRSYLKRFQVRELESRDREGYDRMSDTADGLDVWAQAASAHNRGANRHAAKIVSTWAST